MKISIAQVNSTVGDLQRNYDSIISFYNRADSQHCDLIIFPELVLSGYLIKDHAFSKHFLEQVNRFTLQIVEQTKTKKCAVLLGLPMWQDGKTYNSAALISNGSIIRVFHKTHLPNYELFDEKRIFEVGNSEKKPVLLHGIPLGILICEDLWHEDVALTLKNNGASLLICINASPYDATKQRRRTEIIDNISRITGLPVVYVNRVGADDHVVFDGGSCMVSQGDFLIAPHYWQESLLTYEYKKGATSCAKVYNGNISTHAWSLNEEQIYNALIVGVRDFFVKNNFENAVLGLSGGIDSALVALIIADAIGSDKLHCLALPSQFSSNLSYIDAEDLTKKLGCRLSSISINEIYSIAEAKLRNLWGSSEAYDVTEENLQARIRGLLLMAVANKSKSLLVATSNKSELAVGYATIYGDMCGALAPIADLYKMEVYKIAQWRNINIPSESLGAYTHVINSSIITKPPSAELKENQKDQDSLPPYEVLDQILHSMIEMNMAANEIIAKYGFDSNLVLHIQKLILKSEFKRHQAPMGIKVSAKMLTIERRMPITFGIL